MLDRLFSIVIFVLLFPLFILISILIFLEDGMPIIFSQKRVGKNNIHFNIFKFRTMKTNTPDIPTHLLNAKNVKYTYWGPILRELSLDEIPQLVNIIIGNMKFIGPRPALYNQHDLISLRNEKSINELSPGITGWAQVNGRDKLSIAEKVKMDEYYKNNKSFFLDLKILYLTFVKVLKSEDMIG